MSPAIVRDSRSLLCGLWQISEAVATGLQIINNAAPELFEITGDPIVGTIFT
jgi:hypothetical protein